MEKLTLTMSEAAMRWRAIGFPTGHSGWHAYVVTDGGQTAMAKRLECDETDRRMSAALDLYRGDRAVLAQRRCRVSGATEYLIAVRPDKVAGAS